MSSVLDPQPSFFSLFEKMRITLLPKPRLLIVYVPSMPPNVTSTCSGGSQGPASARDAEKADDQTAQTSSEKLDIEHVHVEDDPRKWSNTREVSPTIDLATRPAQLPATRNWPRLL